MQTIYYGAPGTGKSFTIDNDIIKGVHHDYVYRVTFYPDFSYSDFIGQLLPVVKKSSTPGGTCPSSITSGAPLSAGRRPPARSCAP